MSEKDTIEHSTLKENHEEQIADNTTSIETDRSFLEETLFADNSEKFTLRKFIKQSKIAFVFFGIGIVFMIVGLIIYYLLEQEIVKQISLWLMVIGAVIFLLASMFGFQKVG